MKNVLTILLLLIGSLTATAQQGLSISRLFEGRIIPQERMVETRVRGKTLAKYQLTFYRSLRFTATEAETQRLRQLVDNDSRGRFVSIYDTKSTYTHKVQVPPLDDKNRFLCYQEQPAAQKGQREVTVIYMEGTIDSLEKLEKLLK
ncbi:MAG: hypothetical protein IJ637_03375 [Prevotella sp.]|nr:hypothetical protein [Prevotella sp.]